MMLQKYLNIARVRWFFFNDQMAQDYNPKSDQATLESGRSKYHYTQPTQSTPQNIII
jgi:uncharacterized protein YqkB